MVAQAYVPTQATQPSVGFQITDDRAFCRQVNLALDQADFDAWLEGICRPYCTGAVGRPLGMFFRLIVISYLRERGSLESSSRIAPSKSAPIELLGISTLLPNVEGANPTSAIYRLPLEVHRKAFTHALGIIVKAGLLDPDNAVARDAGPKRNRLPLGPIHKETGEVWTAETCEDSPVRPAA
jgi:hypothetical protein